ncbi:zinc finger and BTB domain-containing protein 22 isoform X2 [Columba livia]|uniref:zinc finger and BTB domain-containing protein 22 isoform X2 n=1 Tax=Columba livia TaxID=8932 RepID=UPI0031BB7624
MRVLVRVRVRTGFWCHFGSVCGFWCQFGSGQGSGAGLAQYVGFGMGLGQHVGSGAGLAQHGGCAAGPGQCVGSGANLGQDGAVAQVRVSTWVVALVWLSTRVLARVRVSMWVLVQVRVRMGLWHRSRSARGFWRWFGSAWGLCRGSGSGRGSGASLGQDGAVAQVRVSTWVVALVWLGTWVLAQVRVSMWVLVQVRVRMGLWHRSGSARGFWCRFGSVRGFWHGLGQDGVLVPVWVRTGFWRGSRAAMEGARSPALVHVDFPEVPSALLANLNRQREEGTLCDVSIHVQGRVFRAHRAVLAASSPFFHDQVLLKNMTTIVLPGAMDPGAFETVLGSAYTGRLSMAPEDIVNLLTVGSVLQMWHIVDKCTELLRQRRAAPPACAAAPSSSSSSSARAAASGRASGDQSPSSTNYCSPRDAPEAHEPPGPAPRGGGAEGVAAAPGGEDGGAARRPLYVQPSIVPHKQWVFVKQEWLQEDLVLTCEEDEDPAEGPARGAPGPPRGAGATPPPKLEEQVNFCESSEDLAAPYEALEEPGALAAPRALLPVDMQGNPLLLFPAAGAAQHGAVPLAGAAADGNKIFMCHCGKAFSHKSMRDRHVNMHLNLRPFGCPVCAKKFKMKHHLTEHMKTHTGLKPYACDACAKRFMWRDSFMRHKGHCERRHRGAAAPAAGGGRGGGGGGSPGGRGAAGGRVRGWAGEGGVAMGVLWPDVGALGVWVSGHVASGLLGSVTLGVVLARCSDLQHLDIQGPPHLDCWFCDPGGCGQMLGPSTSGHPITSHLDCWESVTLGVVVPRC